ncbi:hypothetical protein D3Z36_02770 [Lachnospiraceae bacterium]|nr:hypothetical protein [Lachnospiraceae bacterium]
MALTNAFYEAVNKGNVRRIRIMMKDSLLVDPSFLEFREMERAAASVRGLYDPHDGRVFENNKEAWDDNYMDRQMVQVISNFSHERIEHLKEVVHYLRPAAQGSGKTERKNGSSPKWRREESYEEQKRRDQQEGRYLGAKVAGGAVAGAIVGSAAAWASGVTVAGGAVVGAFIGGTAVYLITNGGK